MVGVILDRVVRKDFSEEVRSELRSKDKKTVMKKKIKKQNPVMVRIRENSVSRWKEQHVQGRLL